MNTIGTYWKALVPAVVLIAAEAALAASGGAAPTALRTAEAAASLRPTVSSVTPAAIMLVRGGDPPAVTVRGSRLEMTASTRVVPGGNAAPGVSVVLDRSQLPTLPVVQVQPGTDFQLVALDARGRTFPISTAALSIAVVISKPPPLPERTGALTHVESRTLATLSTVYLVAHTGEDINRVWLVSGGGVSPWRQVQKQLVFLDWFPATEWGTEYKGEVALGLWVTGPTPNYMSEYEQRTLPASQATLLATKEFTVAENYSGTPDSGTPSSFGCKEPLSITTGVAGLEVEVNGRGDSDISTGTRGVQIVPASGSSSGISASTTKTRSRSSGSIATPVIAFDLAPGHALQSTSDKQMLSILGASSCPNMCWRW